MRAVERYQAEVKCSEGPRLRLGVRKLRNEGVLPRHVPCNGQQRVALDARSPPARGELRFTSTQVFSFEAVDLGGERLSLCAHLRSFHHQVAVDTGGGVGSGWLGMWRRERARMKAAIHSLRKRRRRRWGGEKEWRQDSYAASGSEDQILTGSACGHRAAPRRFVQTCPPSRRLVRASPCRRCCRRLGAAGARIGQHRGKLSPRADSLHVALRARRVRA